MRKTFIGIEAVELFADVPRQLYAGVHGQSADRPCAVYLVYAERNTLGGSADPSLPFPSLPFPSPGPESVDKRDISNLLSVHG
jgi:hypothetical protein